MTTSASAPASQRIDSALKADRESHLDVSPVHGLVEDRQLFLAFADFISWDCRSVRFRMSSRIPPDYSSVPSGTQNRSSGPELNARERSHAYRRRVPESFTRETYPPSSKFGPGTFAKGNRTHKF
ncbi:hypothetical protein ALC57_10571 [Trachymyrmex cornetzi]|uniref:Uncharacterized protein n=1 Tax=Trachymyrmex cornetzi TaxID=471704 RepID=A0A151J400_9HYME|nr:hypothetical protein ALC57_10571 [Trachymyrmex cornetzi]